MADCIIVFEVVLQAPLIVERTQTEVTEGFMTQRVVNMILEAVTVLEHAPAQVAVIIVLRCHLDMAE